MKVLMLNPPFHRGYSRSQRSAGVIRSGVMYYPLWLAYATGVLEQAEFKVKLVDAPAAGHSLTAVLELAQAFCPRLVVLDTSTPSIFNDLQAAEALKSRLPDSVIVLVGPHVSAVPEPTLRMSTAVDAVAIGEYDYTLRDLAVQVAGGGDLATVAGLCYRLADGTPARTAARPLIDNLDDLPFVSGVYRRHLRVENYFYSIARYPEITLVTSRGCPYACDFCLWPQTLSGRSYRQRSVGNVADEFEFVAREFPQVKEIFLEDAVLTADEPRAQALAEELKRRGNRLPFTANVRADVSYAALRCLRQAGLRLVCVGFESAEQSVLDAVHKNISADRFHSFCQDARRAGVLVHGCFMAGNPGETRRSLEETLRLALALDLDTAQFFPLMVYPGTRAYSWAKSNGYLLTDDFRAWLTPDGFHRCVVERPELSAAELMAWCDRARRAFYLRPRYWAAKAWQAVTRPAELGRMGRAAVRLARHLIRPA